MSFRDLLLLKTPLSSKRMIMNPPSNWRWLCHIAHSSGLIRSCSLCVGIIRLEENGCKFDY